MNSLFLLRLAKALAPHRGITLSTIGSYAAGDSAFFSRIEKGGDCTTRRAARIADWFDEQWPEDLEWPRDIPRPSAQVAVLTHG